jgi:hypothetical protein
VVIAVIAGSVRENCSQIKAHDSRADPVGFVYRLRLEMYRLKANKGVGFSRRLNKGKIVHHAIWMEEPWQLDENLAQIIESERPRWLPGQNPPGRNELCYCGSGKKFKKCCGPRLRA